MPLAFASSHSFCAMGSDLLRLIPSFCRAGPRICWSSCTSRTCQRTSSSRSSRHCKRPRMRPRAAPAPRAPVSPRTHSMRRSIADLDDAHSVRDCGLNVPMPSQCHAWYIVLRERGLRRRRCFGGLISYRTGRKRKLTGDCFRILY